MTKEQFNEAVNIISRHHSTQMNINAISKHFVGNIGSTIFRLHITRCVPSVVKELIGHGYLLSMTPEGLEVDKI